MKKLWEKNEVRFSVICILVYILLFSLADSYSMEIGIQNIFTAPVAIAMSLFLWSFVRKNHLSERYGLVAFRGDVKQYLFFFPLILLASVNLWNGVTLRFSILVTFLNVISMLCTGFLEELIFRGFLFRALCEKNVKRAILISSLTFGIGHISNLLRGEPVFETILQLFYACAIGLVFTVVVYKGKSLIPVMITHSVFNSLAAFAVEGSKSLELITAVVLCVISIAYGIWILKKVPESVAK